MLFAISRSYPMKRPTQEMRGVLKALGLQAKNIRHRALFFIRNVLSSFDGDWKLKAELYPNEVRALEAADRHIALINAKRTARAATKKGPHHRKNARGVPCIDVRRRWHGSPMLQAEARHDAQGALQWAQKALRHQEHHRCQRQARRSFR